jgi:metal-dependent amidase/aminoacylase/carboxypeptidase family protein
MAAVDTFEIHITGVGGHGAMPHETADPIPPAIAIAQAMPTIVSRNNYALDDLVISVTQIHAGPSTTSSPPPPSSTAPSAASTPGVQDMVERRMGEIVAGHAAAFGVKARLDYIRGYPATINDAEATLFAASVAASVVGAEKVDDHSGREMGAEDFAYMLQERPGRLPVPRCGAGRGAASPRIRLQRRDRAHRGEPFRAAGGPVAQPA